MSLSKLIDLLTFIINFFTAALIQIQDFYESKCFRSQSFQTNFKKSQRNRFNDKVGMGISIKSEMQRMTKTNLNYLDIFIIELSSGIKSFETQLE